MNKGHSVIGASSAHRWFECPGSVNLIPHAPPQEQNEHAARGTAAHMVLEECFYTDKDPWNFEGHEFEGGELDEADIEAVIEAIDYLDGIVGELEEKYGPVVVHKEVAFDLSRIHPSLWGTGDIVLYTKCLSFIGVYDYKHGKGVLVEVQGNKQLMYYLLGAINFVARGYVNTMGWGNIFREMEIGIIQPRANHEDGAVRTTSVTSKELDDFSILLHEKATDTDDKDASFSAGSHCRWCPAQPICPQLYNKTTEIAKADFGKITPKPPSTGALTNTQIGHVLENEEVFTSWMKSVKALAQQKLERGEDVPGFKLVKKKANRVWKDEEHIAAYLKVKQNFGDYEIYEQKIKSPTKIEKLLGGEKHRVESYFTTPDNGNTIAKETDRRKEVQPSITTDFTPIERN